MRMSRLIVLWPWTALPLAQGDVLVTLVARDAAGVEVTEPVPAGTTVVVDVLLAVDAQDDPLSDVRHIQFDFRASDATLTLGTFSWRLGGNLYEPLTNTLPTPSATSFALESSEALLQLTQVPMRVATIDVTVNGTGVINAVGPTANDRTSLASIRAGFDMPREFSLFADNLRGGTLELEADDSNEIDSDGDGVPDSEDDFDDDPDETTDTDGDGVGNNADIDDDNDGVDDEEDAFPLDETESVDSDGDGVGDNADAFDDDPAESVDTDLDGIGNNEDDDDDGDGVVDADDAFPLDPTETKDSDGDGVGDNAEENSNTGPRVTGSLCGALSSTGLAAIFIGLCFLRFMRGPRSPKQSCWRHVPGTKSNE